jgi:hypothetical protein
VLAVAVAAVAVHLAVAFHLQCLAVAVLVADTSHIESQAFAKLSAAFVASAY